MPITSTDLTALAAYAGKYEKTLFRTLFNGFDALKDLTVIPNVKNKLNMTKLKVKSGLKPYTGNFVAETGALNYTPRVLNVDRAQADFSIHPEDYRTSFLSEFVAAGSEAGDMDIPFPRYTWETVLGQLAADVNDRVTYFGRDKADFTLYVPATTYAVDDLITFTQNGQLNYFKCLVIATANQSPDANPEKWENYNIEAIAEGYGQKIAAGITASDITPVATGVITAVSKVALTAFRKLYRAHPESYKKAGVITYCSYTDYELLLDDCEENITKFTRDDVSKKFVLPGTNGKNEIRPVTWLSGSRRLICTPKQNLVMGVDRLSDMNHIETDKHIYTMDAGISFVIGFQIRDFDALKVGDQS